MDSKAAKRRRPGTRWERLLSAIPVAFRQGPATHLPGQSRYPLGARGSQRVSWLPRRRPRRRRSEWLWLRSVLRLPSGCPESALDVHGQERIVIRPTLILRQLDLLLGVSIGLVLA